MRSTHALSILIDRLLLFPFALPVAPALLLLFRHITAHPIVFHSDYGGAAVIALVGYQFFDALQVDLRLALRMPLGFTTNLFGYLLSGFGQRVDHGLSVALVSPLQRNGDHSSG